ncbi:tyrosine-type recombinase/integrase [Streptomyces sp. NPDC058486]|uniref:tyrosine-type recombinase/integrase n=1 Tax=unclassified Streptomyces TaxID=2593676 RepID=UPI00365AD7A5
MSRETHPVPAARRAVVVPVAPKAVGRSEAVVQLRERFPPRPAPVDWPATRWAREEICRGIPGMVQGRVSVREVVRGADRLLAWLEQWPGETWQARWLASGAQDCPADRWRAGRLPPFFAGLTPRQTADLSYGLRALICADVLRPDVRWMVTRKWPNLLDGLHGRDPEGITELRARAAAAGSEVRPQGVNEALGKIAVILACKGGLVADITVGDCVEYNEAKDQASGPSGGSDKSLFYVLLHSMGVFPPDAPTTIRVFGRARGQLSVEQLVDRYGLVCRPVRDVIVDYLRERQPRLDYTTLNQLSSILAKLFWADLEAHHPGIDSLRLDPSVAVAWKSRMQTKTRRIRLPDGTVGEVRSPRLAAPEDLGRVRAFYLDIAQWAVDDPARWAAWAVPCPISAGEANFAKQVRRRKARMDQRTRERLPVLPQLAAAVAAEHRRAAELLETARATVPGTSFTAAGQVWQCSVRPYAHGVWADDPQQARRNLETEEKDAFWAWAAVEVLRHTGIRIEELLELSHHAIVQYHLPSTGEVVPLLQIVPSKTDEERLLLVTPELADVLSHVVRRVRDATGAVPVVPAYDTHEKVWLPPMPWLFQYPRGGERRRMTPGSIRRILTRALSTLGLAGADGTPLQWTPHDFRRMFVTDAVVNGLPPHIAQIICGHKDITTTMGYKAVYPGEAIEAHRAFVACRRALRPGEEYRTPSEEEWEEFLGHFERRKLSVGTCGRAFGTACVHEHACVRCATLRPDPAQRTRLQETRDNLVVRIAEAEREGWLGEIEGLRVSLAGAEHKLSQLDDHEHRPGRTVDLGMPGFGDVIGRSVRAGTGT